jgi:hypothetical protein
MVTLQIVVKAGSVPEPKDKAGLAHLTAALLPLGTVSRTAPEISEAIEFVGGSLNADASWDSSSLSLTVLKKDLDMGMALLADVLLHPAFRETEIARKVREIKGHIRQKQEDPGTVAREAFATIRTAGPWKGRRVAWTGSPGRTSSIFTGAIMSQTTASWSRLAMSRLRNSKDMWKNISRPGREGASAQ